MKRKIMWVLVAILTSGNMLAQQVKYAVSGSFSENGKMVYLIVTMFADENTKQLIGDSP